MMDSMTNAELDGKVNFSNKDDPGVESRIRRIAAGSGTSVPEVLMLLQVHRQFEGMVGKSKGLFGKNAQARQQQMAAQMRKNPNLIQQRLNQMDPRLLQQMGGRDHVMQMMQQMAKSGGTGPGGGGMDMNAMMNAMGGGGMDMNSMMNAMGGSMPGMGGGAGGFPGVPAGMNMESLMQNFMGAGGMPPNMGGGTGGANRR